MDMSTILTLCRSMAVNSCIWTYPHLTLWPLVKDETALPTRKNKTWLADLQYQCVCTVIWLEIWNCIYMNAIRLAYWSLHFGFIIWYFYHGNIQVHGSINNYVLVRKHLIQPVYMLILFKILFKILFNIIPNPNPSSREKGWISNMC